MPPAKRLLNSVVFIVYDSARFDHVKQANVPNLKRIGKVERRYSYASWTSPSHFTLLMGMMPHRSPRRALAATVYRQDLALWKTRTGCRSLSFPSFLPEFSLPKALKNAGYSTHALVSLPVLNPSTPFARHFDSYRLMPRHDEFHRMLPEIRLSGAVPKFYFLNLGETHYPYSIPGDRNPKLPVLHGVHGAVKHMGDRVGARFFSPKQLKLLKERQIAAIEYLDSKLGELLDRSPENTHFIVTSDHGELFGENGYFGHGPIFHPKVFEVPFVEGRL